MAITPSHRATGADIPEEKKILVQTSSDAGDLFGRGVRSLLRHELWYSRMSTATAFGVVGSPELIASILIETATARSACSSSFLRAGIGCSGNHDMDGAWHRAGDLQDADRQWCTSARIRVLQGRTRPRNRRHWTQREHEGREANLEGSRVGLQAQVGLLSCHRFHASLRWSAVSEVRQRRNCSSTAAASRVFCKNRARKGSLQATMLWLTFVALLGVGLGPHSHFLTGRGRLTACFVSSTSLEDQQPWIRCQSAVVCCSLNSCRIQKTETEAKIRMPTLASRSAAD